VRIRTEKKRREIIEVAAALFEERGFEGSSMDAIVQRMGGSKSTLYGYFPSKEALLRAVLDVDLTEWVDQTVDLCLRGQHLCDGLARMGTAYLSRRLSPLSIAHLRIGSVQSTHSPIGSDFHHMVLKPAWRKLADRFERLMEEGKLDRADPWVAAMHWKGLNEGDMLERRLLGDLVAPDAAEIRLAATCAAQAFLKIYGR